MNPRRFLVALLALSLATGCVQQTRPTEQARPTATSTASPPPEMTPSPRPTASQKPCLASGNQDDINDRLRGPGDVAVLCPGAVFELTGPIVISADGQQVYTEGFPTDARRATMRIVSATLTTAVRMRDYSNAVLSNVIVDGNRPNLGYRGGDALVYAGGSSDRQIIRAVKITEPRSWSALQLIQGHPSPAPPCSNALVEDNEVGPAGSSDETWADGISLACTKTIVRNNRIIDATDGGIVIFGAPGSFIEDNTIRAETRTLLGGINMVDYDPYDGNYSGTVVRNNGIDASGAVIRIGLGMGTRVWGCLPTESDRDPLHGATVTGNTLRGTRMQYGFAVDGVTDWTATDNVDEATHSGRPTVDCRGTIASAPTGFQFYPPRADGVFQPEFEQAFLELALWAIPSPRPGE